MSGRLNGAAQEEIPFDALVLSRGGRVSLAGPEIANGIARERKPYWGAGKTYAVGAYVAVEPIEGLGARDLQAMAAAPLMDANRLFLPAGKLSMAETREREARIIRGEAP